MRYAIPGPWSILAPIGINGCTSSSELDAQHVSPHQKRKRPHLQEKDMPVACFRTCHVALSKAEAAVKTEVSEVLHSFTWKNRTLGSLGPSERQDFPKRLMNGKAICFTLLRRITRLKCVNSEVKSVKHLPHNGGSLKWVHGTMSESPWKSH